MQSANLRIAIKLCHRTSELDIVLLYVIKTTGLHYNKTKRLYTISMRNFRKSTLLGTQMCFLGVLAKKIALLLDYSFAETCIAGIFGIRHTDIFTGEFYAKTCRL